MFAQIGGFDGLFKIAMDSVHTGIEYFEICMEHLWGFLENFYDIFGAFGYIVAFLEFTACFRIILELLNSLESKIFGTNFYFMQTFVLKLISRKNYRYLTLFS